MVISSPKNANLPAKLTHDAILEAVLDIRFEHDPKRVSEIFFGKLALKQEWQSFEHIRSPVADLPESIRRTHADFRYQSSIQLISPDGRIAVQVGPQVFVYSRRGHYPGWDEAFWPELMSSIDHLFQVVPKLSISRLGLRYINALRSDVHGIKGINDLDLNLMVAGEEVNDHLNINYTTVMGEHYETMTRVTSVDLAQGQIPENTTVIVDIDVYTTPGFEAHSAEAVKLWATEAHMREKQSFFSILGTAAIERLRAD